MKNFLSSLAVGLVTSIVTFIVLTMGWKCTAYDFKKQSILILSRHAF